MNFLSMMFWHSKHEVIHLLLGLLWIYILSKASVIVTNRYIILACLGSLFPDIEHFIIHVIRKKKTEYGKTILAFVKAKQFRNLIFYIEENHKTQSFLPFHHVGTCVTFVLITVFAFQFDRFSSLAFFGAVATHYIFDMVDDVLFLKRLNPNWTRGIKRSS